MTATSLRDYGLPNHANENVSTPRARPLDDHSAVCPHCGCRQIQEVTVYVVNVENLKGNRGIGRYLGCPACPWASPMVITATAKGGE